MKKLITVILLILTVLITGCITKEEESQNLKLKRIITELVELEKKSEKKSLEDAILSGIYLQEGIDNGKMNYYSLTLLEQIALEQEKLYEFLIELNNSDIEKSYVVYNSKAIIFDNYEGASDFNNEEKFNMADDVIGRRKVVFNVELKENRYANGDESESVNKTNTISQFGIKWKFDKEYEYGQYANGDYWVKGSVKIIEIEPASIIVEGRTINGSMINPRVSDSPYQGYDSAMYSTYGPYYNEELNAARPNNQNLSAENPLIIDNLTSLVSTISTENTDGRTQLKTAAVLTIVKETPRIGSFRPSYCGIEKETSLNIENIDWTLLKNLDTGGMEPDFEEVERYFERPWLDHIDGWRGAYQFPEDNMYYYARENSEKVGIASLMLNSNFSNEEKTTLLYRFLQLGIDYYGVVKDGGSWSNDGGIASGRKWPILFAGIMLNDANMKSIGEKSGDYLYSGDFGPGNPPVDYIHFGEDDQTFYVDQYDVDITNSDKWDPDNRAEEFIPYEESDFGLPEWGIRHATYAEMNNKAWDIPYRRCCTANAWSGWILAAHIMNAKSLWNHNVLFDYQDRYMAKEQKGNWMRVWSSEFVEYMWDRYRENYGEIWQENRR